MDDRDITKVGEYVEYHMFEPDPRYDKNFIRLQAYCQWAGDEILKRMISERDHEISPDSGFYRMSAEEVVLDFAREMDYYQNISESKMAKQLFETAYEEACSILHYIRDSR